MPNYCSNCGVKLTSMQFFCAYCGERIVRQTEAPQPLAHSKYSKGIMAFFESKEYAAFLEYFDRQTIWDILAIQRSETCHSAFLRWLFDDGSRHGITNAPLRALLTLSCVQYQLLSSDTYKQGFGWARNLFHPNNACVLDMLSSGAYRIEAGIYSECEKSLPGGRIDIYLKARLCGTDNHAGETTTLVTIIENKIYSSELMDIDGAQNSSGQTVKYADWAKAQEDDCLYLFLYLTPPAAPACDSDEFLHLDYQELMKHVLEPAKEGASATAQQLMEDYILCLSKPVRYLDDKRCDETINYDILANSLRAETLAITLYEHHTCAVNALISKDADFFENAGQRFAVLMLCRLLGATEYDANGKMAAYFKTNTQGAQIKAAYYKGREYRSYQRVYSIGALARELIADCAEKSNAPPLDNLRERLRPLANRWLREIILTEPETLALPDSVDDQTAQRLRRENTTESKERFNHAYFSDRPISYHGEMIYIAKYWGMGDVLKIAEWLGYTIDPQNALYIITQKD